MVPGVEIMRSIVLQIAIGGLLIAASLVLLSRSDRDDAAILFEGEITFFDRLKTRRIAG